jgi:4-hydroxy-3-methylbut-2-en-1-yl diphosphate reductase
LTKGAGAAHRLRMTTSKPLLTVKLCSPRGFCAGVVRAIDVVEAALVKFGAPVYVRHEIVHNRFVVDGLKAKGAIFVKELDEVPPGDATCPLVTKVHREAEIHHKRGRHVILIGHAGHPEVIGTMGQLPPGAVTLIETVADVARLPARDPATLAFVTQTTLSVDDTAEVIAALQARFPGITAPHKEDICYATTNRQEAVKAVAPAVEAFIVVGAPNSSNSQRLREVAERSGCRHAVLLQRASDIDWAVFGAIESLGVTAGASAPEVLVEEMLAAFAERYTLAIETVSTADESVFFPLPRELREVA